MADGLLEEMESKMQTSYTSSCHSQGLVCDCYSQKERSTLLKQVFVTHKGWLVIVRDRKKDTDIRNKFLPLTRVDNGLIEMESKVLTS